MAFYEGRSFMKEMWNMVQVVFAALGGALGYFLGECDGLLIALVVFVVVDYITGVMVAVSERKVSSAVGYKGILKKIFLLIMVGVAHVLDAHVMNTGSMLRTAVIFFYLSNEGISIIENAGKLGIPVPEKVRKVLEQLKDKEEGGEKHE